MVSSTHEAMHRIFQHDLRLFSRLSGMLGLPLPPPVDVTVLPTDLTESAPVERRVDTLLRLDSADDGSLLLAIEAQGKRDAAKPASWAYYTAYLWTKYRLPTALLVVCQDRATAEWAGRSVCSGPPHMPTLTIEPVVVGPHNMPVITDPAEARADLALTTLSAITHAGDPDIDAILKALSTALQGVPDEVASPIVEFTAQGLGNRPAGEFWRKLVAVDLSFYKSFMSEEIRDEGRAQGRTQQGAKFVLALLRTRGLAISDDVRERITDCTDLDQLDRWHERAATVSVAEDIFMNDTE